MNEYHSIYNMNDFLIKWIELHSSSPGKSYLETLSSYSDNQNPLQKYKQIQHELKLKMKIPNPYFDTFFQTLFPKPKKGNYSMENHFSRQRYI